MCKFEGCESPIKVKKSQLCNAHYIQHHRGQELRPVRRAPRGSGYTSKRGYRWVSVDGKMRQEHRVVMEKLLGRSLEDHENVHHINGVRWDNRPENLEVWSTSQPSGQRPEDKTNWAIEWLKIHKPEALEKGYRT